MDHGLTSRRSAWAGNPWHVNGCTPPRLTHYFSPVKSLAKRGTRRYLVYPLTCLHEKEDAVRRRAPGGERHRHSRPLRQTSPPPRSRLPDRPELATAPRSAAGDLAG